MKNVALSLIVPCYNEEKMVSLFYEETLHVLQKMTCSYGILFIDDGSTDDTLSVMENLAKQNETVRYISFSRNFGKEAAIYAGFCNTNGKYVVTMDVDMQDPPTLLRKCTGSLKKVNMIVLQQEESAEKENLW